MKLQYLILAMLVLTVFSVYAAQLDPASSEIEIPYGENSTASLPLFSRTYLRVYEGSWINFNIVDPDTNAVLIRNSIAIKEVKQNFTTILLSVDGGPIEETTINLSEKKQINYTYKFLPFMEIKEIISHYEETKEKRNVVLFFNVPFMKTGKNLNEILNASRPNLARIRPNMNTNQEESGLDNTVIAMITVIVLLVIALVYIKFKRFKKLKSH